MSTELTRRMQARVVAGTPNLASQPKWRPRVLGLVIAAILVVTTATCAPTTLPSDTPASPVPVETPLALPSPSVTPSVSSPIVTATATPRRTITPSTSPTSPPTATTTALVPTVTAVIPIGPDLTSQFSADRALTHVHKLATDIGPRPAGSEGEAQARAYIATTLRSYGYSVDERPFSFSSFKDTGSVVRLSTPQQPTITAEAMAHVGSVSVTGELVPVGLGLSSDFAGQDLTGKVALIKRGLLTFREKVVNAQAAGVSGIIIYNSSPGLFFGGTLEPTTLPVLAIPGQDGERLADLARYGQLEVTVEAKTAVDQRNAYNIMGQKSDRVPSIIVGAHYDTVAPAPGANDNASGIAVMLELAQLVAGTTLADQLGFVAFGGEEIGLLGSKSYVNSLSAAQLQDIEAMINLDMVGEGPNLVLRHSKDDALGASLSQDAQDRGVVARIELTQDDSDHAPFDHAGVSVFHLFTGIDPYYHTAADTADKIELESLTRAGRAALFLLKELSQE